MEVTLRTGDWQEVLRVLGDPRASALPADAGSESEEPHDDAEDDDADPLADALARDPILWVRSGIYNGAFGDVFLACEGKLRETDFYRLGRFIASFCLIVGDDGKRFPVPQDADFGVMEWYSVMSPETLRELVALPEHIDRRALRAAVREVLTSGKASFDSVAAFFDYLDLWTRAYRLAAAEGRCAAVHTG
ncbi:MAG TPA: hypothetical protein VNN80_30070 [Polyangiaceae bacterium]|jgi:hypothetical protein|nr:hypothetical protein [Polyangiaceae bacterium]